MQAVTNAPADAPKARKWWREPMMWLVLGGPLAVVIAGVVTAVIAMRAPDPVLAEDYYRRGLEINKTLAERQANEAPAAAPAPEALRPAVEARNHAATPQAPR